MNKEEFKAKFLKQFNNPDSGARALLYDFCRPWSKDNGIYRDRQELLVSEFGLVIDIRKIRKNDDMQYFDVNMVDLDKYSDKELSEITSIDDLRGYQRFYMETVSYARRQLIFKVELCSLKMTDYIYELNRSLEYAVVYDLESNAFLDKPLLRRMLDYIKLIRGLPEDAGEPYVEVSRLLPDVSKILNSMKAVGVPNTIISRINKAFHYYNERQSETTSMTDIITNLLSNDIVYPF